MVLPWGSLECVGVADTLKATGLTLIQNKPPKCYTIDRQTREILSWAEGYEDGGSFVSKREFPVMLSRPAAARGSGAKFGPRP
ncbi:hypothetical protein NKR19_g10414 [Coniochaeta hoffmannii]|uniref:Uncharacterized protein n=1 Tax=Coniochaeta hoffmannii TaxID=91930 RepID=A0AA38R5H4_9PEZI|nr:hypothetical protein NKR19_g10414 [Coniochaeta hoffmannii]